MAKKGGTSLMNVPLHFAPSKCWKLFAVLWSWFLETKLIWVIFLKLLKSVWIENYQIKDENRIRFCKNNMVEGKKSIKIWYCLQFVCWSLSWELGDGVSIAKRNVVVFPPSTTYRHSLKEEKLHFLFGVIMALRSWWLICLVTFKKSSNYNIINHLS